MQTNKPINTPPLQLFIEQVKGADLSNQQEIRMPLQQAKQLAFTVGEIEARLHGTLEQFVSNTVGKIESTPVEVSMDGGGFKEE